MFGRLVREDKCTKEDSRTSLEEVFRCIKEIDRSRCCGGSCESFEHEARELATLVTPTPAAVRACTDENMAARGKLVVGARFNDMGILDTFVERYVGQVDVALRMRSAKCKFLVPAFLRHCAQCKAMTRNWSKRNWKAKERHEGKVAASSNKRSTASILRENAELKSSASSNQGPARKRAARAASHPRVVEGVAAGGSKDDQVLFVQGEELPRIVSHMVLDTRDAKVWLNKFGHLRGFHYRAGSKEMFSLIGSEGSRKAVARLGFQVGTRRTAQGKNGLNYKGHGLYLREFLHALQSKQHRVGGVSELEYNIFVSADAIQTTSRVIYSKSLQRFSGCTNVAELQHDVDVMRFLALRTVEPTKDEELEYEKQKLHAPNQCLWGFL